MASDEYVCRRELAKKLNVTTGALLKNKNRVNGFPAPKYVKIKGQILFDKKEIENFMKRKNEYVKVCTVSFSIKEKYLGGEKLKIYKFGKFNHFLKSDVEKIIEYSKNFYTIREAADYLKTTIYKIRDGVYGGLLSGYPCPKYLKLNNLILFRKKDLDQYVFERSQFLNLKEISQLLGFSHRQLLRLKNQMPELLPEPAMKRTKLSLYPKNEIIKLLNDAK